MSCSELQCVTVCCSVMQFVAGVPVSVLQRVRLARIYAVIYVRGKCVAVCYSVLQCVAVCCSIYRVLLLESLLCVLCVAMCCSVLQCVAVCCSVLQCVAMCCSCCRVM